MARTVRRLDPAGAERIGLVPPQNQLRRSVRCQRIGQPDLDVRIESGDEISDNKQWVRHKSGGPKGVAR